MKSTVMIQSCLYCYSWHKRLRDGCFAELLQLVHVCLCTHSSRESYCTSPVVFILFMYSTHSTETDIETERNGWYDVNMTVHENWMQ